MSGFRTPPPARCSPTRLRSSVPVLSRTLASQCLRKHASSSDAVKAVNPGRPAIIAWYHTIRRRRTAQHSRRRSPFVASLAPMLSLAKPDMEWLAVVVIATSAAPPAGRPRGAYSRPCPRPSPAPHRDTCRARRLGNPAQPDAGRIELSALGAAVVDTIWGADVTLRIATIRATETRLTHDFGPGPVRCCKVRYVETRRIELTRAPERG